MENQIKSEIRQHKRVYDCQLQPFINKPVICNIKNGEGLCIIAQTRVPCRDNDPIDLIECYQNCSQNSRLQPDFSTDGKIQEIRRVDKNIYSATTYRSPITNRTKIIIAFK